MLAAITAGAALGFLVHNFHPASVFMGDCGSNLLGLLLGAVIVEGSLKTNALVALVVPLVVLAVPFLDTGFVVAKRIKYRRPVYRGDSNHFHHRFHRIGFSQRRTVLYLYAWTITMAGLAVALRFIPYSDDSGHLDPGWTAAMAACFVIALAASAYLVYVLEILKLRRLRAWQLRRTDPDTTEHEIDEEVERELETGEFTALGATAGPEDSNPVRLAALAGRRGGLYLSRDRSTDRGHQPQRREVSRTDAEHSPHVQLGQSQHGRRRAPASVPARALESLLGRGQHCSRRP